MIGLYVERLKGWEIVCDVCGEGPLGHVSGVPETEPDGYTGYLCAEHAPQPEEAPTNE